MTGSREQLLAAVEAQLRAEGTALEDLDRRIAERLGVPVDYYFAYLLVRGAIDAHAHDLQLSEPLDAGTGGTAVESAGVRRGQRA